MHPGDPETAIWFGIVGVALATALTPLIVWLFQ
jgi:hypothetical protein